MAYATWLHDYLDRNPEELERLRAKAARSEAAGITDAVDGDGGTNNENDDSDRQCGVVLPFRRRASVND